jgi:hypothetical protein
MNGVIHEYDISVLMLYKMYRPFINSCMIKKKEIKRLKLLLN